MNVGPPRATIQRMRFLPLLVFLAACVESDPQVPSCKDMNCEAIACGDLTPDGDKAPTVCTCQIDDDQYVTCRTDDDAQRND